MCGWGTLYCTILHGLGGPVEKKNTRILYGKSFISRYVFCHLSVNNWDSYILYINIKASKLYVSVLCIKLIRSVMLCVKMHISFICFSLYSYVWILKKATIALHQILGTGSPVSRNTVRRPEFEPEGNHCLLENPSRRRPEFESGTRVGNFRQNNYSAEDRIDRTNGFFRRNSGCSAEQKISEFRSEPFRGRENNSEFHSVEPK